MRTFAVVFLLTLAACGQAAETPAAAQQQAAQVRIENAWAAPTPGGVEVSAGYLTIVNSTGSEDALIGVSSPRAGRAEVHEMTMQDGVMQMRAMTRLPIAAGQSVTLAPGGRHLMFFDVAQPFAEGETIPVRLTFERAGAIDVSLPVRRQGASHTGHTDH